MVDRANIQENTETSQEPPQKALNGLIELPYENPIVEELADANKVERKATTTLTCVSSKNLCGQSPEQVRELFKAARAQTTIYTLSYKWIEKRLKNYLLSLYVPIKEKVMEVVTKDDGGKIERWTGEYEIVGYKYAEVPTKAGIARALNVAVGTLTRYLEKNSYTAYRNFTDPDKPNYRDIDKIRFPQVVKMTLKQQEKWAEEQHMKFNLIELVFGEYLAFHEKRLGLNENVSGSIFALLNANNGWSNKQEIEHSVSESLLGKMKSREEIEEMANELPDFGDTKLGGFDD